ncbi:MAG: hypothetical protein ACOY3P_25800 [Planctomycetota bacterium]
MSKERRAISLLEVVFSLALLAGLVAFFAPMLRTVSQSAAELDTRQLAAQAAANLLERVTAVSYAELLSERLESLARDATDRDPELRPELIVEEFTEPIEGKRITATVHWENAAGNGPRQVSLVTWRYRDAR